MSFGRPKNSEKMFLLDKTKSFAAIYLHYIIIWIAKKTEILRGS